MHVIYVDDERLALKNFEMTVASFTDIDDLHLFDNGAAAIEWVSNNPVDIAFLDMEMPVISVLELAKKLHEINCNIRVIFVTAYSQYALDAFNVDAIGYVMKPYMRDEIRKEIDKAMRVQNIELKRVKIQTIPHFAVSIDGKPFYLGREKSLELFAFIVDKGERGTTAGECIASLWPERPNDAATQSLFRMTYKRLLDALEKVGAGEILMSKNSRRFLCVDKVDCDLYKILAGDKEEAHKYDGQYLDEYSWAESRNGQLYRMLLYKDFWTK